MDKNCKTCAWRQPFKAAYNKAIDGLCVCDKPCDEHSLWISKRQLKLMEEEKRITDRGW